MKTLLLAVALSIATFLPTLGQIGIGTTTPHESAILDVSSKNKGFLLPRMTEAQKQVIVDPANGLMIYNYDTKCLEYFVNGSWINPCCEGTISNFSTSLSFLYKIEPSINNYHPNQKVTQLTDPINGNHFNFSQGLTEQGDSTFIYNANGSISRTQSYSTSHYGINALKSTPNTPIQQEMEFFMVGRFDDTLKTQ